MTAADGLRPIPSTTPLITVMLPRPVAHILDVLVDELLAALEDPECPATRVLFPDPYPTDSYASAELVRLAHEDLVADKQREAHMVADVIGSALDDGGNDPLVLRLAEPEAWIWLRVIANARLVVAVALGVFAREGTPSGPFPPAASRYLAWCYEVGAELSTGITEQLAARS